MTIQRVTMEVIPHEKQRLASNVGDYFIDAWNALHIRVSDTGNDDMNFLIQLHEFIEEHLTRRRGLTEPEIQAFDEQFEREKLDGLHPENAEAGFSKGCPYLREHMIATGIEMQLAGIMGIDWQDYEEKINSLGQDEPLQPPEGSQPNI